MLRVFLVVSCALLLFAPGALADPVHIGGAPAEPSKKLVRKEIKAFSGLLRTHMKISRNIWQRDSVQKSWNEEKECAENIYSQLPEEGPLTDLQALYTISGMRALQLHILGPDGKTHSSFRSKQKVFAKLARRLEIPVLQRLALQRAEALREVARFPDRDLCQWSRVWQEAGKPGFADWAGLWKYAREINQIAYALRSKINYKVASLLWSLLDTSQPINEEIFVKLEERARWLSSAQPYSEGFIASRSFWKNTLGENYP